MTEKELFQMIGDISDKYIEEAAPLGSAPHRKNFLPSRWSRYAAAAAAVMVLVISFSVIRQRPSYHMDISAMKEETPTKGDAASQESENAFEAMEPVDAGKAIGSDSTQSAPEPVMEAAAANQALPLYRDGRSQPAGSYILPHSAEALLTKADLDNLTSWGLTLAKDEILARHGAVFSTEEENAYFLSRSWYQLSEDAAGEDEVLASGQLSETEKSNYDLLAEALAEPDR